jgi:nicotinamide mononucleotide adenylyltransferase
MENFKENVQRYIKTHKGLHGTSGLKPESVAKDLAQSFGYDYHKCLGEISHCLNPKVESYGVFIGRLQPFHLGHEAVINEIILDGRKPIIVLGSIDKHDEKNPLSYEERIDLIRTIYCDPNDLMISGIPDNKNWDLWCESLMGVLFKEGRNKDNVTIYIHEKPEDLENFKFKGNEYVNEHWSKIFEIEKIKTKNVDETQCSLGLTIHASDIRSSEDIAKRNLDARIFWKLKNKGWYI